MTGIDAFPYAFPMLEMVDLVPEGAGFMNFSIDPMEPGTEFGDE